MNPIDFTKLKPGNYNRKSSETEDRQVLSVISQIDEARRLADFYRLPAFIEIFQESKSAKIEFLRPEFNRLMSMIESGKIDTIVCWKLDRIARNMTEGGKIIDLLSSGKIKAIITHDKVFYPSDNVIVMSVEFSQGKQYVKDLSLNVKRGHAKKARLGYPHGLASLGFLNDKSGDIGNRKWIVDEKRFPIIKELFRLFLNGDWSVNKLAIYARNELRLNTPNHKKIGGELITISRMFEILKNPIYAGFFYHEDVKYDLNPSLPRIISEDDYVRIQKMISNRNMPKVQFHQLPYAGYIKSPEGYFIGQDIKYQVICDCKYKFSYRNIDTCPNCQKPVIAIENPKHLIYRYYYNVKRKKSHLKYKCLNEKEVDSYLIDYINKNLKLSKELAEWSRKHIREYMENELSNKTDAQTITNNLIERLNLRKKKLRNLLIEEYITREDYKTEIAEIEAEIENSKKVPKTEKDWLEEADKIIDVAESMVETVLESDTRTKRDYLSKLGSNLVWDEEKLSIINRKPVQRLIDGLNLARKKNPSFEPEKISDTTDQNLIFRDVLPTLLQTWDKVRNNSKLKL